MATSYIELHAASAFSFLQGASLPEMLVDRAAELAYPAIALLDRDGVYGAPRFHKAAVAAGLKPIIGAELTIGAGGAGRAGQDSHERSVPLVQPLPPFLTFTLPVLCESQEGYQNLCRLITRMKLRAPKGEGALALDELEGSTRGLVALVGRASLDRHRYGVGGLLDRTIGLFGRESVFVELQRHFRRDEEAANQLLVDLAAAFRVPVLATNGVRFATPDRRPLFDVLTCIHHHTDLAHAGKRLAPNAERYLKAPDEMASLFADVPDAIRGTVELADRLQFTMADLGYRFPDYPVPPGETQASFLRRITDIGARERYRPLTERARAQITRELDLIEKLNLAGYFLIVWDIVNFCRQHEVLVQGRGSAANSAVCYSLGITAVDPVSMDLLFERFLSEERGEWPDIDLDLPSGDRRESVIQHVYEKYGGFGAAMTANVITYRGRSAAREVGKALGFEPLQIDRLAKVIGHFEYTDSSDALSRHLSAVGLDLNANHVRLFARLWGEMQDLPRHLGQHSGGMVICQGQLDAVVPLENATMPGRVVVQWDKDDCAEMGIVKVDLLGLGMMAVLQDTLALVNGETSLRRLGMLEGGGARASGSEIGPLRRPVLDMPEGDGARASGSEMGPLRRPVLDMPEGGGARASGSEMGPLRRPVLDMPERNGARASGVGVGPHASKRIDLAHLPPNDPAVYKMLQEADTIGLFQVESRAQMATLPRLKPACFYDLVVEVAIIRPGPIVGQMVHPYLNRRAGREPVSYPHPSLEPILARTLGVPLFQEQLLRMAMVAAGFSGGQAEELRRALGFKRSMRRMKQIEVQLRDGMARKGIVGDAAEQIITSIASFALYGFPESHAASFALLAYASAYFKVHYPAAFYTAMLNNQPMGFYHPSTLVKDAQRRGVRFHPIDVQISDWDCTVEEDGAVRLGLRYVSGLRERVGRAIANAAPARTSGVSASGDGGPLRRPGLDMPECYGARASASGDGGPLRRPGLDMPERDGAGASASGEGGPLRRPVLDMPERDGARASGVGVGPHADNERCPKCGCDDASMIERVDPDRCFCNNCSHDWRESTLEPEYQRSGKKFTSLDDLVARTGLHRDELVTLADIGALNAFGYDRRSALWQAERAIRPSGELFENLQFTSGNLQSDGDLQSDDPSTSLCKFPLVNCELPEADCPLKPMTEAERLVADYAGMKLTIGRHPMALRREELAMRGVLRAGDLQSVRRGRRVRVAGMVITRQRPGTAKGFVFLTLEDETGIANIIVRPDLFARDRLVIVEEQFLIIDGILQNQDGVTSVRAEQVQGMRGVSIDFDAHDFY